VSLFLFTPGLAAVGNLIGHNVAMLVCYSIEALGSHPPWERTIGIPNGFFLGIIPEFLKTVGFINKKCEGPIKTT
jgi:hypothetical protein